MRNLSSITAVKSTVYTLGVNDKIFAFSIQVHLCFVLFCLRLYVPVNNFSVLSNGDEVSF